MSQKQYYVYEQGTVNGAILMSTEVFNKITCKALSEIEGINFDESKAIECTINDTDITININLNIKYGINVNSITKDIQEKVFLLNKELTNIEINSINVNVENIEFE